jgi:hypothetical protein
MNDDASREGGALAAPDFRERGAAGVSAAQRGRARRGPAPWPGSRSWSPVVRPLRRRAAARAGPRGAEAPGPSSSALRRRGPLQPAAHARLHPPRPRRGFRAGIDRCAPTSLPRRRRRAAGPERARGGTAQLWARARAARLQGHTSSRHSARGRGRAPEVAAGRVEGLSGRRKLPDACALRSGPPSPGPAWWRSTPRGPPAAAGAWPRSRRPRRFFRPAAPARLPVLCAACGAGIDGSPIDEGASCVRGLRRAVRPRARRACLQAGAPSLEPSLCRRRGGGARGPAGASPVSGLRALAASRGLARRRAPPGGP